MVLLYKGSTDPRQGQLQTGKKLTTFLYHSKMSLPKSFPLKAAGGKTIEIPSVGFGTWASGNFFYCPLKY
jgi:hypothetical protein